MGWEGKERGYVRTNAKRELAIIIRETSKNSNGMSDEVPRHKRWRKNSYSITAKVSYVKRVPSRVRRRKGLRGAVPI